jgi:hypothetical protein
MTTQLVVRRRKSDTIESGVFGSSKATIEWVHFDKLLTSPEKQKRIIRENKAEFRSVMRSSSEQATSS